MNLCDKCPTPLFCERTKRCQFPGGVDPAPSAASGLVEIEIVESWLCDKNWPYGYNKDRIREVLRDLLRSRPAQGESRDAEVERLVEALRDAADSLYNSFEPDNQSNAYKAVYEILRPYAAMSQQEKRDG